MFRVWGLVWVLWMVVLEAIKEIGQAVTYAASDPGVVVAVLLVKSASHPPSQAVLRSTWLTHFR